MIPDGCDQLGRISLAFDALFCLKKRMKRVTGASGPDCRFSI